MNDQDLLHSLRLPARLTIEQTALLLGFLVYECSVLMRLGLLHPLGKPPANGHKYFSAAEIEALSKDRQWLDKASRAVTRYFQERNRAGKKNASQLAA